jgi:putative sigma-54 modulation protein
MNITITARHFNASAHLQTFARESVSKLNRFYDGIMDVDVILAPHESHDEPQRAELVVSVSGQVLKATEQAATYESALNKAVESMSRQLLKYKEKRSAKG